MREWLKPSLYWWAEAWVFSGPVWCCGLSSDTDSICFKRQWEPFLTPGGCHSPDSLHFLGLIAYSSRPLALGFQAADLVPRKLLAVWSWAVLCVSHMGVVPG